MFDAVMTPEQLLVETEGRSRDRLMTRAESAAYWGPREPNYFMQVVEDRAITHGRVRFIPGADYIWPPSYGCEVILDRFVIATRSPADA